MEMLLYLVPVFGILGLLFAAYLAARVGRQDAGNDRMKEIAAAISDGAQAFLTAEYKILIDHLRCCIIYTHRSRNRELDHCCMLRSRSSVLYACRLLWNESSY